MAVTNFSPVILAGGKGTRLWPLSGEAVAKPFLRLPGLDRNLLQLTQARLAPLTEPDGLFVSANEKHAASIRASLPSLGAEQLILEPSGRDTAPAVFLSCLKVTARNAAAVIGLFPADHVIANEDHFRDCVRVAVAQAEQATTPVLFGLLAREPSSSYGYIRLGVALGSSLPQVYPARGFVEKPERAAAEQLIAEGCLWNGGIFIGRAEEFLRLFAETWGQDLVQHCRQEFTRTGNLSAETFARLPKISFDHGILQRQTSLLAVHTGIERIDVGNFESLARLFPRDENGNTVVGEVKVGSARGCILINSTSRPLLTAEITDLVVIQGPEGTLVSPRAHLAKLKKLQDSMQTGDKS